VFFTVPAELTWTGKPRRFILFLS